MKELSVEEKAKRYDEAIIRGSRLWESDMITRENYEYIFPEVKESEDEEIKEMLKVAVERTPWMQDKKEKCYEWLEKQGEQKPVDDLTQQEAMDIAVAKCFEWDEQNPADEVGNYDHKKVLQTIVNEQKPAWSEEDEKMLNKLLAVVNLYYGYSGNVLDKQSCTSFLKSLKDRYTWKPSDEQMEGLECTIKTLRYQLNAGDNRLDSLYNDLKKLREE